MRLMLRIGAVLLLLCTALPAVAQSLDQAKAAGQIGERIDGYVGVVDADAPPDIRALVDRVNAEREAKYAQIAAERGVSVQAVAQIAGEALIERTPSGQWVLGANGQWRQK